MDFRQLRIFKAVFDAGSIVGAADAERCAPSVVAHHLSNLENSLKQVLFERSSRGVVPTAEGQQFHHHVVAILRAVDNAETEMRDRTSVLTGRVVVGLAYSAVVGLGLPFMQRVMAEQPALQLEIAESVSGATIEHLFSTDIDIAVAYNPPRDPRLALTPLLEEEMLCLGKPELVGDVSQPMTMDEFLSKRFVLARRGPRGRPTANERDIQKQLETRASLFSQNVAAATLFVNAGLGVILGTWANLRHGAFGPDIVGRPIAEAGITRTLYICERSDTPSSGSMNYIRSTLLDCAADEISSGRWPGRTLMP